MSDLLPPNATAAERALAESIARISDIPPAVRLVWNPDTCPSSVLPWLAWAFSVDEWDSNWSDNQKRGAVKSAVSIHKHKGTIGAVKDAINALGIECQVQEWFNQMPEGAPYTFRLILDANQEPITQSQLIKLQDVVNSTKNLRSHLDTIVPGVTSEAMLSLGVVAKVGSEITVSYGGGGLILDGTWMLDGTYKLNGLKVPA